MKDLRARIRQSLANAVLQAALDANAERRLKGRAQAFASLPDVEERRARAQAIRVEVIAHWEQYLAQFISRLQQNGIQVHRAANAAEAVRLVLEIIGPQSGRLIAKSKSMVSEEVELNAALEAAGHRVVETDLGEYIVQLRGERPSHIITPAVHLRRQEVAQLFQEKLGLPYTEDVALLTQAARRVLRQVFLTADVGISGINFGVAESGSLCIVTNEGNGRMVTTLPPKHIALMGLERLVPRLDDLALMLSLLPRSATGQKISVYTQLIHAPFPGQERHLILLDNGRQALRQTPLEAALHCIRCGACLNACPAFREMGGHAYGSVYPGPIGSVISPALFGHEFIPLAYACTLCGACAEVCPVKIPLPDLLIHVRAGHLPQSQPQALPLSWGMKSGLRLYTWLARHPRAFALAQAALAALLGGTSGVPLPKWTGWGQGRWLPRPAKRPFRAIWQREGAGQKAPDAARVQAGAAALRSRGEALQERAQVGSEATRRAAAPEAGAMASVLLKKFCDEWRALGGEVILAEGEVLPRLLAWLQARQIARVYLAEALPEVNTAMLQAAGIEVSQTAETPLGLTGVLAAIAETGTLVLSTAQREQAAASLLPWQHLAIVRREQVVANLEAALALPAVRQAPAVVLVSGPSRTADIEMTLTIGVHGPGETAVLLV